MQYPRATIDLNAIRHNLELARQCAPRSKIMAVIKADAYGHGIARMARALDRADVFAVATPAEAQSVRDAGWQGRLLLLEGFANKDDFDLASRLELELVVHSQAQLECLKQMCCRDRQRLWIKLDTGMHRLGFPVSQFRDIMGQLGSISNSGEPVLMTHFACADDRSAGTTGSQIELFDRTVSGFANHP